MKPDGGPAFPRNPWEYQGLRGTAQVGLSLRDFFAAAALPAVVRNMARARPDKPWTAQEAARISYEVADAMLAEREEP